jgi:hypothetical protein
VGVHVDEEDDRHPREDEKRAAERSHVGKG